MDFNKIEDCMCIIPILKSEIAILERLSQSHNEVRKAVCSREWVEFDKLVAELNTLSDEFEALESKRTGIFSQFSDLSGDEEMSFHNIVKKMPEKLRGEFSSLYRQLKILVVRIRVANDTLMSYIHEAKATMTDFLEAVFPDRKGRLYTRQGTQIQADMRSMVLDRSL